MKQNRIWEKAWGLLVGGAFIGMTPKFEFIVSGIFMMLTGVALMLRASHKMEKENKNQVVNSAESAIIES